MIARKVVCRMTKREARAWAKARRTELDMAAVGRGMAQALFGHPEALLLDEPFSRLDKTLRTTFRTWVFGAVRARNIPVVLVTHDDEDIPPGGEVIEISRWQ